MNIGELLQTLRATLRPQGTLSVVKLEGGYFNSDPVQKAIDQLETMMLTRQEATPLETIGIEVLLTSIGYKRT